MPEPIGLPIMFAGDLDQEDSRNVHFGEIAIIGGQLVTAGAFGWTAVVTGTGTTVSAARSEAYRIAQRLIIPNVRYRNDIGTKLVEGELSILEGLGLLGDDG